MADLLIVGGGLFGSLAAALARSRGIAATVFDPGLEGAASPAAAGLFREEWAGKNLADHYPRALRVLERVCGIESVTLRWGVQMESFLFVPPRLILDPTPVRQRVTAIGDGWLEADGRRHEGNVYLAAGVWCAEFVPGLSLRTRAGSAYLFDGERAGQIEPIERGRQAIAFVRDPATTYFSDGTAEEDYTAEHDARTLARALSLGLNGPPSARLWGRRPYTPGGVRFERRGAKLWMATGGRKMGTILGASLAARLVEEELG